MHARRHQRNPGRNEKGLHLCKPFIFWLGD